MVYLFALLQYWTWFSRNQYTSRLAEILGTFTVPNSHPFSSVYTLFWLILITLFDFSYYTLFNLRHKGSKAMAPLLNGMAADILLSAAVVSGQGNSRLGGSPSYQGFNSICPER